MLSGSFSDSPTKSGGYLLIYKKRGPGVCKTIPSNGTILTVFEISIFPLCAILVLNKSEVVMEDVMDIWERMYEKAKEQYHPEDVSPFVYAHHVVCALEAENGEIYTGFCIESCSGVLNLCAERVATLNMYVNSGQTKIKRLIAFRDSAPSGGGSGMPCGACREFLYQLNEENEDMEIMLDYEKRETVTLKELIPNWWGHERFAEAKRG